jgi:hypothetical protein
MKTKNVKKGEDKVVTSEKGNTQYFLQHFGMLQFFVSFIKHYFLMADSMRPKRWNQFRKSNSMFIVAEWLKTFNS